MEFIARLGKDKTGDISFPRTEMQTTMKNGFPVEERVPVGEGVINKFNTQEEVNLEEIKRMETLFDQGYLELFTMSGAPTTILQVLYDGVAPALTPTLLRGYDREQLVKLSDQFGMETREVNAGDDKPHDKSTRDLRGALTAFVLSSKYKKWRVENEVRLQKESIEDRVKKAEQAEAIANEARDLAEKQLAAAKAEMENMKEEPEPEPAPAAEPVGEPVDDPPMAKPLPPEPTRLQKTLAEDELDDDEDPGEGEGEVDESEFTQSKLMHRGHAELQDLARDEGLEDAEDWTKGQLTEFTRFRKGLIEFEDVKDPDVREELEDYLEPEPPEE